MTTVQRPPNTWARRSLKTMSSLVNVDGSGAAREPMASGALSPDSPPLLSAIGSEAEEPPRASESAPPSGWSLVAGRSKPASLTFAGTSDPLPPSTCEGIAMVSDQLAPRVTAYAAAPSAAAEKAALQLISPYPYLDCAAGPSQDSIDCFFSILESKRAVNLLARRSLCCASLFTRIFRRCEMVQSLGCAYIPRSVAVPLLFLC